MQPFFIWIKIIFVQNKIYEKAERLINTMNRHDIKMCNLVLIRIIDWNNIIFLSWIFLRGIAFQGVVIVFLQHSAFFLSYFGQQWTNIKTECRIWDAGQQKRNGKNSGMRILKRYGFQRVKRELNLSEQLYFSVSLLFLWNWRFSWLLTARCCPSGQKGSI